MKLNKIIVTVTAVAIALAMAGCGGATGAATSAGETSVMASTEGFTVEGPMTAATEAMTGPMMDADDTNVSVLNYEGAYTDTAGKGYGLLLTPSDDANGAYVSVGYMDNEEIAYYMWDIFGEVENNAIVYSNSVCTAEIYDEQAENGHRSETVYSDGKGTVQLSEDGTITWKDEKVNNGEEIVFEWNQELNDQLKERQEQAQTGMN